MRTDPESIRNEAHSIISGKMDARQAWSELRQWASGRGPLAMKSAMMEFLEAYGGTPEAACIMPEIMRNASFILSPQERVGIMHAALGRPKMDDLRSRASRIASAPAHMAALRRPEPSLSFRPLGPGQNPALGRVEPLVPAHDHAYLRDMPIRSRDRLETALPSPKEVKREAKPRFDSAIRPDSRSMPAHRGERIVRSLIGSLRSHASDDAPHMSSAPAPRKKHAAAKRPARKHPVARKSPGTKLPRGKSARAKASRRKNPANPARRTRRK